MKLQRGTQIRLVALCILLLASLGIVALILAPGHGRTLQTALSHPTPHVQVTHIPLATPNPSQTPTDDAAPPTESLRDRLLALHYLQGPNGWMWHTSLPENRLVVFYGNPLSPVMGPIGQFSDDDLVAKLRQQAQAYANLDPGHPVVPALDYVTPVVQADPMSDGSWVYRMPTESIDHYVSLANNNHMLFFFDMQIGHSTVQKEVNLVWSYLQQPGVDLSLDPEFDMPPGAIPDQVFGRMTAAEINWVINALSNLVQTQHLPPKILIIHQFLEEMLPDWQKIKAAPGVEIVTCVDGFGPPGTKIDDYRMFDKEQLIQYPGMKLFYTLDKPLMSPSDVLALDPSPLMVMYQ